MSALSSLSLQSALPWIKETSARYSDVVSAVKTLALNTFYLGSLLWSKAPLLVPRGTLLVLSYSGVEWIPYSFHYFTKLVDDIQEARRAHRYLLALTISLQAFVVFGDITLIAGNFSAAFLGLMGHTKIQNTFYDIMRPWSYFNLALGFGLLFAYLALKQKAVKELKLSADFELTPLLRAALDKDINFKDLESRKGEPYLKELLIKLLQERIAYDKTVDLSLRFTGYLLLALQKFYHPTTLASATLNEIYSLGCLVKLIYEKIFQAQDRKKMSSTSF